MRVVRRPLGEELRPIRLGRDETAPALLSGELLILRVCLPVSATDLVSLLSVTLGWQSWHRERRFPPPCCLRLSGGCGVGVRRRCGISDDCRRRRVTGLARCQEVIPGVGVLGPRSAGVGAAGR